MAGERGHEVRLAAASFVLAATAGAVLLFAPLGTMAARTGPPGGIGATVIRHPSGLGMQGWAAALPMAVPAAVAGLGLAAVPRFGRRAARVASTVLGLWVVVGVLSVGLFFAPSALAMAGAGWGAGRSPRRAPA
jgi:hypothetical protein